MAPHHVTITIQKLQDLFVDSIDDNPLISEWEADAGIQRVANYLMTRPLARHVQVSVRVPDTLELTPARTERVRAAIHRYCDARISENQRERQYTIITGVISLAYSVVLWVVITFLFNALLSATTLPDWFIVTADLFYILIAWALLWGPIESILFTWLPNLLSIRVYRTIRRSEFAFVPVQMSSLDDLL
jgi:uncharacterized membrane protein YhdT